MMCLQFVRSSVSRNVTRPAPQRYIGAKGFQFMDAELIRIERNAANKVAEIIANMNVVFQHDSVVAMSSRDQTPRIGMAEQTTDFRGAKMRPECSGEGGGVHRVNLCTIDCANTRECKLLSAQLLLHPMKSLNVFIKVYNVNLQNVFLSAVPS